jgi:hypothetical protein
MALALMNLFLKISLVREASCWLVKSYPILTLFVKCPFILSMTYVNMDKGINMDLDTDMGLYRYVDVRVRACLYAYSCER